MKKTILLTSVLLVGIVFFIQVLVSCGGLSLTMPERDNPFDPNGTDTVSVLPAPSSLSAEGGFREIILSWVDNSIDETGFSIERSSDSGSSWSETKTVASDTLTWTDTGLGIEETYIYRVKAVRAAESSDWSTETSATTLPLWQTVAIDDANDSTNYWETAITVTENDDIFINYRKNNIITSAWLKTGSNFAKFSDWQGKTQISTSASGIYTDLLSYSPDTIVTIYNEQHTNDYGDYYSLLYKEFNGVSWTNEYTIDAGDFDSTYGAFNTGNNCVFSRHETETYLSVHYLYHYFLPGMDWYDRIDVKSKTGEALWSTASQIDADAVNEDAYITTASSGSTTWTFWEDNGMLYTNEGADTTVDGAISANYGMASVCTSDGTVHILYSYYVSAELRTELRYKYYNGASFVSGNTYSNSGSTGFYPAVVSDSHDTLHSVFQDYTSNHLVYRYKPDGKDWNVEILGVNGTYPDITVDSNNRPVISYYNIDSGKICAARRME